MPINITNSVILGFMTTAAAFASPPNLSIDWYTIDGGGGKSTGGTYELYGTVGQPDVGNATGGNIELASGFWQTAGPGVTPCTTHGDCADLDGNDIRDNNCTFWACEAGACVATDIVFADMGGQFGLCPVDGTADGNDRFHALNCFANTDPNGGPGDAYTCEVAAPTAFNVDAGGSFGSCAPDGVCDGNDAFAALNAFGGSSSCSCPLDGAPAPLGPLGSDVVEQVALRLQSDTKRVEAGQLFTVDVRLDSPVHDLRGYQLHATTLGGDRGALELIDIAIDDARPSVKASAAAHVFSGLGYWDAYNLATRQVVVGLDDEGVPGARGDYLATLTFKASPKAAGTFVIDLLTDSTDAAQRSFLFPTPAYGRIDFIETVPATIMVSPSTR